MKISILGDSISTYEGVQGNDCSVYYDYETNRYAKLNSWHDTWWGIVIDGLEAQLLCNHSYSGSCISSLSDVHAFYPSAISPFRYTKLHYEDQYPDIILVYLGINDWLNEVCIEQKYAVNQPWYTCFKEACEYLCKHLKKTYPETKIYLISPILGTIDGYLLPSVNGDGVSIKMFQHIIEDVCIETDLNYLDISKSCPYYSSMDGFHPDKDGMKQLGEAVLMNLKKTL